MKRPRKLNLGFDRFSALYLGALFLVVFGILSPSVFLTSATLHIVASGQAIAGILALAVLIPTVCGEFDLSVGANANLTGILAIVLQNNFHWAMVPAVLVSVAAGFAVGAANGFVVVKLGVNSFIATLGMMSILGGIVIIATGSNEPSPVTSTAWNSLSQRTIGGFQIVLVYLLVLSVIAWWLLEYTPAGQYLHAIGSNPEASRLAGVRVKRWSWLSLILSGGLAGFGGILYTSLSGPSLTFGSTLLLPAFAAVFLGSTQLQPGRFNVWGTLIAIYVLATGVEGLQLVSGAQWVADIFNGTALILAVGMAVARTTGRTGRRRRKPDSFATEPTDQLSSTDALGGATVGREDPAAP